MMEPGGADVFEGNVVGVNGLGGNTGADTVGFDIPVLRAEIATSVQQGTIIAYMSEERAAKYMMARAQRRRVRITIEIVN